jgi:hypothetical protein
MVVGELQSVIDGKLPLRDFSRIWGEDHRLSIALKGLTIMEAMNQAIANGQQGRNRAETNETIECLRFEEKPNAYKNGLTS